MKRREAVRTPGTTIIRFKPRRGVPFILAVGQKLRPNSAERSEACPDGSLSSGETSSIGLEVLRAEARDVPNSAERSEAVKNAAQWRLSCRAFAVGESQAIGLEVLCAEVLDVPRRGWKYSVWKL